MSRPQIAPSIIDDLVGMPDAIIPVAGRSTSSRTQLSRFMSRYTPKIRAIARQALKKLRARLPGAVEMVYDNYNALVIAFGPTDRASEAIFSIALYPRWVTLFLLRVPSLRHPKKIL